MGGIPPGAPGKPGLGKPRPGGRPGGKPGPGGKAAWGGGGPILEVVVVAPLTAALDTAEAAGEVEVGDTGECGGWPPEAAEAACCCWSYRAFKLAKWSK